MSVNANIGKSNSVRFKVAGIEDVTANPAGMDVTVHLAYDRVGDKITVTSDASGYNLFSTWTQSSSAASWEGNKIHYEVRGYVTYYLLYKGLWEIRRVSYSISGDTQYGN